LIVIVGTDASAFDTGQFALEKATFSSNSLASTPGTLARVSSSIFSISGPAPRWTTAVVSIDFGGNPAVDSCAARNIEKHPACAAPINSSGVVPPAASSNRVAKVKGASR
jgi:hypothetical protein